MKKIFLPSYLVLIFIVFFLAAYADARAATSVQPASTLQPIGQVIWVKGNVESFQPGKEKRPLQRRSVIYAKDTLVTDANSSAEIVFTDNSTVALRSGTQLKIDTYHYDSAAPQKNKYAATLVTGGFRTITGLISKGHPENYEVNTPVATIGVRGTIYTIAYAAGVLSLEINKGAIVATNQAGSFEMVRNKTLAFSQIQGAGSAMTRLKEQPMILKSQPAVTPAAAPSIKTLQTQAAQEQSNQPTQKKEAEPSPAATHDDSAPGAGGESSGSSSNSSTSSNNNPSTNSESNNNSSTNSESDINNNSLPSNNTESKQPDICVSK